MDSTPILLPADPPPSRRPPVPFIAALVPVVGGVVLWGVTGSLLSLCFAALGPLMVAASVFDGLRSRRGERRRSAEEAAKGWARAERQLRTRQREVHRSLQHRHPDVMSCLLQPPLQRAEAVDESTEVVIGRGAVPSGIRVTGGEGERAEAFRRRSSMIAGGPVVVPLGRGICVRAPRPIGEAMIRALAVQIALRFGARQVGFCVADGALNGLEGLTGSGGRRGGQFLLGITDGHRVEADALLWLCSPEDEVPEGMTTVIECTEPSRATVHTASGIREVAAECLSSDQAEALVTQRCASVGADTVPDSLGLDELDVIDSGAGLAASIGRGEAGDVVLDIVEDGPHAIVAGITGTGKSELLVTWVTAIAASHSPDEVVFVLADFKGGTAFDPLRVLPHVVAVITDLDEDGARRGVSSLTAELRRREGLLAASGSRDVRDGTTGLPRLVVVVDEFAALLQDHPDLGGVFTDVAARGRALGMHLILGTQRASGVVRDALAANCPLRVSLRVSDPADSRLVIGSTAAAELPGGAAGRGLALIRRPRDEHPGVTRVALTAVADVSRIAARVRSTTTPTSPWLPALPAMLPLESLPAPPASGVLRLGLRDDPDRQSQPPELLRLGIDRGLAVVGGPGSGKSSALRLLTAQHPAALRIPRDPEAAWDLLHSLPGAGSAPLVLCDDIDALIASFPGEYGARFVQRWEEALRSGAGRTMVVTTSRTSGAVARLLDALPKRAILRTASRMEHLAAGGEATGFLHGRAPGRARIEEHEVQLAWVPVRADEAQDRAGALRRTSRGWRPRRACTAVVTAGTASAVAALVAAFPDHEVVEAGAEIVGPGRPVILVGDAELWQRNWSQWQRIRAEGEILVRAECAVELRQLAGVRELPPFARLHEGRAWSLKDGAPAERVIVRALAPR